MGWGRERERERVKVCLVERVILGSTGSGGVALSGPLPPEGGSDPN